MASEAGQQFRPKASLYRMQWENTLDDPWWVKICNTSYIFHHFLFSIVFTSSFAISAKFSAPLCNSAVRWLNLCKKHEQLLNGAYIIIIYTVLATRGKMERSHKTLVERIHEANILNWLALDINLPSDPLCVCVFVDAHARTDYMALPNIIYFKMIDYIPFSRL